jgi:hypothetical protein
MFKVPYDLSTNLYTNVGMVENPYRLTVKRNAVFLTELHR